MTPTPPSGRPDPGSSNLSPLEAPQSLFDETFALLAQLDATDDPLTAAGLAARIAERSDELGGLAGWSVVFEGELLCACLEEQQALDVQFHLLVLTGDLADVAECLTDFTDFVHPDTDPRAVVKMLVAD